MNPHTVLWKGGLTYPRDQEEKCNRRNWRDEKGACRNAQLTYRREAPAVSRPDRKVGREDHSMMSAEGAAQKESMSCASPLGLDDLPNQYPELTLGSTHCRRFAPQPHLTFESGFIPGMGDYLGTGRFWRRGLRRGGGCAVFEQVPGLDAQS